MHSQTSTTQTGNQNHQQSQEHHDGKEQQTRVLVNMLFARFKAIYTHKFASAYSSSDDVKLAKREWAIAIKGLPEPLLAFAVERVKETCAWPPTIAEFLQLINTAYSVYGLPSPREAYLEACQCRINPLEFRWSHAVVYHAGAKAGWYNLRAEEEVKSWPAFEKAYDELVAQVMQGQRFSIPVVPLIENQQENEFTQLMAQLMEETSLSEAEIAQLLYYTQKTKGTGIRAKYRQQSQANLASQNIHFTLPE
ncbi:hypothetical protein CBF23_003060 [Marinomonas agarivorans]|nr:hypothetical protein CBF23_003060 [Marinomonas agarivorans]